MPRFSVWVSAMLLSSAVPCSCAVVLSGCGGKPAGPAAGGKAASKGTSTAAAEKPAAPANRHVRVDSRGRKWLDDIPWDVFFDDPLTVASNSQTIAAAPSGMSSASSTPAASEPPPTAPASSGGKSSGGFDWKSLISMELLQEETKRIRNHLTSSLQTQGTYNGNFKEIQVDGAVIAALAGIAAHHDESVSWKANAHYLRDFGADLHQAAGALGKEPYTKAQTAAEKIVAILDGNLPGDAGNPDPARPIGEAANRAGVMKRIEKASEWMRLNINTEAKFKSDLEQIQRESRLLAALGKLISDESYDSASDDEYQAFAKRLVEGGQEAAAAAQDESFSKFSEAMNKINKVCAECHASYGNG